MLVEERVADELEAKRALGQTETKTTNACLKTSRFAVCEHGVLDQQKG